VAEFVDVALNKPATQSSVSSWSEGRTAEEDASRANTGLIAEDYAFHTGNEVDPWWQVDLEGVFRIHSIQIVNRRASPERLRHFTILASLDGISWQAIHTKDDDYLPEPASETPLVVALGPQGYVTRYIRIQLTGTTWLHFRTCQVFGEPLTVSPVQELETNTSANAEFSSVESTSLPAEAGSTTPVARDTVWPAGKQPEPAVSALQQIFGWFGFRG
jgi:hypothetical protein